MIRKLRELIQNQEAKRTDVFRQHELDELRAMKRLALKLFGLRGMLELNPAEPGFVYIGQYDRIYPPWVPAAKRKRKLVLRGATYAELLEQSRLLP